MIPTRYKSKLSHLMSYPISAGVLSEALADVPQINELTVAFFDSCQDPRNLGNPCPVMRIVYSYRRVSLTSENKSIDRGWYGAKWEIMVYPVPRACVSLVKNQLNDEGLEKMRQWLVLHKNATGKDGSCGLYLFYDTGANSLSYREHDRLLG